MAGINDIVLIYDKGKPFAFARIEDIYPDGRKNWYKVKMLVLKLPLQVTTWTLKEEYIAGEEFTIDGDTIRLELVTSPDEKHLKTNSDSSEENIKIKKKGNIIYLYNNEKK